ncbi:PTS sugar transporter subunit IIA [candidate division WOR-3 bacterium]|nr:PTS sugar transporter subunit IIA [candidate division WOR-3 bacterium]
MISLGSFVRPELAFDLGSASSQRKLFETVADRLIAHGLAHDREALVAAFADREQVCSTGVGHGVALPHASTEAAARIAVAVVRLRTPLDWRARDGAPVNLAVAIASPPGLRGRYLQVLSALARALHDETVRRLALGAGTPAQAAGVIANCAQQREESEERSTGEEAC